MNLTSGIVLISCSRASASVRNRLLFPSPRRWRAPIVISRLLLDPSDLPLTWRTGFSISRPMAILPASIFMDGTNDIASKEPPCGYLPAKKKSQLQLQPVSRQGHPPPLSKFASRERLPRPSISPPEAFLSTLSKHVPTTLPGLNFYSIYP